MLSKYVVKPLEAMVTNRMNKTKICSPLLSVPSVSLFSFLPHFFFHSSSTAATSTAHCLWFTRIRNITLVIRFYLACCFTEGRAFCDRKCLLYLRAGPFSNSDTFSFFFLFLLMIMFWTTVFFWSLKHLFSLRKSGMCCTFSCLHWELEKSELPIAFVILTACRKAAQNTKSSWGRAKSLWK